MNLNLKPRRGGLFIATNTRRLLFLFFGGAAFATSMPGKMSALNHALWTEMLIAPRRRKTKNNGVAGGAHYKRATPTGFVIQANNGHAETRPPKMCVVPGVLCHSESGDICSA